MPSAPVPRTLVSMLYSLAIPVRFVSRLSSGIANIHQRLRSIRFRNIFLAAFLLSIGVATAHVPVRWHGGRTGQNADIPLRALTPLEAAALLSGG